MAVATAIGLGIAAASAATSIGMSLKQSEDGRRRKEQAEQDLDNYGRQELKNAYANLSVPMEGYRMREEQIQQQTANMTDMLSMAGARGMTGGTMALMRQSQEGMSKIQADLEQSQFRVKQMIAGEEARIQGLRESREQQDIAGLGAELAAGRQQEQQGVVGAIKGAGAFATTAMTAGAKLGKDNTVDTQDTTIADPYADPYAGGVDPARGYGRYGQ